MKKLVLTLSVALLTTPPCMAQTAAEEALANYDFAKAEELLNADITKLRRRKQPTDREEQLLDYAYRAMQKMSAVERVVVFDSVIVPRQEVLSRLCISEESGNLCMTSDYAGLSGGDGTLFCPQMGDRVYYSAPNQNGIPQLFTSGIYGGQMEDTEPLVGLDEEPDSPHNYPYMMADGETLYFAAQNDESLGGYDIFMTRYDADEHRFLSPENVGMPFNSPANDYLLCIDEVYNIGCFATDRGMQPDSVCVYYFIPNSMRRIYIEEEVGEERLRDLARLSDISLTWGEQGKLEQARASLAECRKEKEKEREWDFTFVVADNRTCHWLTDFHNQQAQLMAQKWLQDLARLEQYQVALDEMRQTFANADSTRRTLMRSQILKTEADTEALASDIKTQEKAIRRAELGL